MKPRWTVVDLLWLRNPIWCVIFSPPSVNLFKEYELCLKVRFIITLKIDLERNITTLYTCNSSSRYSIRRESQPGKYDITLSISLLITNNLLQNILLHIPYYFWTPTVTFCFSQHCLASNRSLSNDMCLCKGSNCYIIPLSNEGDLSLFYSALIENNITICVTSLISDLFCTNHN